MKKTSKNKSFKQILKNGHKHLLIFIQNDKWLIRITFVFFIVYKFSLITISFSGRNLAPEPDDSYSYITLIRLVFEKGLFSNTPAIPFTSYLHTLYTPYVIVMALLAKIMMLNAEEIFKASFYFGTVLLAIILVKFLTSLTKNRKVIASSLFFLALYNGSGDYHGFYWVVPSFFALATFFILFIQLTSKFKYWYVWVVFMSLIFVLMHPISVYASSIFVFWSVFLGISERKIKWTLILRSIFVLTSSVVWFFLSQIYFLSKGIVIESESSILGVKRVGLEYLRFLGKYINNATNAPPQIDDVKTITTQTITKTTPFSYIQQDNWKIIKKEYFDILFPTPLLFLVFALFFFFLVKERQYKVIALYFAVMLFVTISTITWFGYRSLQYLWPITFIVVAYGIFFTIRFLQNKLKDKYWKLLLIPVYVMVVAFILCVNTLNLIWAKNLNISKDFNLDKKCAKFLLENTAANEKINYEGKTANAVFLSNGLYEREANLLQSEIKKGEYLVKSFNSKPDYYEPQNYILRFLLARTSRREPPVNNETPIQNVIETNKTENIVKDCGDFKIYKIEAR